MANGVLSRAAIIVGVNKYDNLPSLRKPAFEAAMVAQKLRAMNFGRIDLLADHKNARTLDKAIAVSDPNAARFLERVAHAAALLRDGGILFVYFAGHCRQVGNEPAIMLRDGDPHNQAVPAVVTAENMAGALPTHAGLTVLLAVDACSPSGEFANQLYNLLTRQGHQAMTIASDGFHYRRWWGILGRYGLLSQCIMKELSHEDSPGVSTVTASRVFGNAKHEAKRRARGGQEPKMNGDVPETLGEVQCTAAVNDARVGKLRKVFLIPSVIAAVLVVLNICQFAVVRRLTSANAELRRRDRVAHNEPPPLPWRDVSPKDPYVEELVYLYQKVIIQGYEDKRQERWFYLSCSSQANKVNTKVMREDLAEAFHRSLNWVEANSQIRYPRIAGMDRTSGYRDTNDSPLRGIIQDLISRQCLQPTSNTQMFDPEAPVQFGEFISTWLSFLLRPRLADAVISTNTDDQFRTDLAAIHKLETVDGKRILETSPDGELPTIQELLNRKQMAVSLGRALRYLTEK